MRYVLTAPSSGVAGTPAYDGDIRGVYATQADAQAAHRVLGHASAGITIVPESGDTYGTAWAARHRLLGEGIVTYIDAEQHRLVETVGYEALVESGELSNAATEA